jgi:hypothetical protein
MREEEIFAKLEKAYFSDAPDEEAVLQHLPRWLVGCKHFVDIGASIGQYTYNANLVMHNGRIDSFEAEPMRVMAKTSGTLTFYSTQSNVSGGIFPNELSHLDETTRAAVNWTKIEVPAVSLDDLYQAAPPEFIKMDIEGAEGEALQGAVRLLHKRTTLWLIELHGFKGGWQPHEVIAFMRRAGYGAREVAASRFLFTPVKRSLLLVHRLKTMIKSIGRMHE